MSLFARLSILFALILSGVGGMVWLIAHQSQQRYFDEKTQQINRPIAMYIAEQVPLFSNGSFDRRALSDLAEHVMIINPGLELYLLDRNGTVVATAIDDSHGNAIGTSINLEPIHRFLNGTEQSAVYGDDPLRTDTQRIFSAYPLLDAGIGSSDCDPCGYVYATFSADQLPGIWQALNVSQASRYAAIILLTVTFCALLIGVAVSFMLTRPLRSMAREIGQWQLVASEQGAADSVGIELHSVSKGNELNILEDTCRQMADRLGRQYQDLERSDCERRELFTRLSHDLRTPLTSLNGVLETLSAARQNTSMEQHQEYMLIAMRQAHRLQRLIDQIFDLARLDSGDVQLHLEIFSFQEMIADTVQEFVPLAVEKGVKLQVHSDNRKFMGMVEGDISQLSRVLVNLLSNAIRCTPADGEINVHTSINEVGELEVSIADTGHGFARELHDVPISSLDFFLDVREQTSREGTGLGLSIVSRILTLHGTEATVSSKPDIGSLVSFSLKLMPKGLQAS